jgi:hypothetical protein
VIGARWRLAHAVIALILGVAAPLPMVFEVVNHAKVGKAPGRHVEAQGIEHHADRCLLDTFHSTPGSCLPNDPALASRAPCFVPERFAIPLAPLVCSTQPPLPRSPPTNG